MNNVDRQKAPHRAPNTTGQYELFPQHDKCPTCGGRLTTKKDGFGRVYEQCGKCRRRTYLQR